MCIENNNNYLCTHHWSTEFFCKNLWKFEITLSFYSITWLPLPSISTAENKRFKGFFLFLEFGRSLVPTLKDEDAGGGLFSP